MREEVLGAKIDDYSMEEILAKIKDWLSKNTKHYVVTPNPEIIVKSYEDSRYKSILNDADLSIPDGIGLKLSGKVKNTVTGIDLMEKLTSLSKDWGFTIGLLGGEPGVAEKAADCLRMKYPGAKVVYADWGGIIDDNGEWTEGNRKALVKVDILFVSFGPPKQEKWIAKNLNELPIKIAVAVGGAMDYIAGVIPRAPNWMRVLGFEWLFRLITQPWRIKRQIKLLKFLWLLARG